MADPILCYRDRASGAAITATNAVATLSAANMLTGFRSQITRISGTTTQIDVTMPGARSVRAIALAGLGDAALTGFSTWTIKASTSALGGTDQADWSIGDSPAPTYGVDTLLGQAFADLGSNVTARYWRINLVAAGATNLEIGRLYFGEALALTERPVYPLDRPFEARALVRVMESGDRVIYARGGARGVTIRFGSTTSDVELVDELERKLNRSAADGSQVLWIMDPDDANHGIKSMVLGHVTGPGQSKLVGYNERATEFTITEGGAT